jgi:hypothetical protein
MLVRPLEHRDGRRDGGDQDEQEHEPQGRRHGRQQGPGCACPPGPLSCSTLVPNVACRQYEWASARTTVAPSAGSSVAPAYVAWSANQASIFVSAAWKLVDEAAATACVSAWVTAAEVGPLVFDCDTKRKPPIASETRSIGSPKERLMTGVIGREGPRDERW